MKFSATGFYKNLTSLNINKISFNRHTKHSFRICIARSVVDFRRQPLEQNEELLQPHVCFKFLRLIKRTIREYGPFVEENKKLASIIKRAEHHNVPYSYIDYAQKTAVDIRARIGLHELLYLNHGFFIIQYEDIDTSLIKHHCLNLCQKYDTQLVSGKVKWNQYFHPKGMLSISIQKSQPFDQNKAKEVALKVGAESVVKEMDLDGLSYWQFHCEPGDLHRVKSALEKENYEVEEAYVGFLPKRKVTLPFHLKRIANSIISDLNKASVIDNVYTNIVF